MTVLHSALGALGEADDAAPAAEQASGGGEGAGLTINQGERP